ncbi:hypothetical protein J3L18_18290 [Mucilaginibacter gossypii]|uniref:hypothetical protein n=1 Tax=Mucilaginibacter gossypii TaxID=551996 RepID=UPI00101A4BCF|nr:MULTISPECIES: hypothetical protein [Mucilaginibacter]QTE35091.1 hypothetical protein J3L18_18290 [Mucilaginibacter gossypii]
MTAVELKEKLIDKINHTDDVALLNQISRVIDLDTEANDIYILSADEVKAVKEGIDQIENGNFLTNDAVNNLIDKCLGR